MQRLVRTITAAVFVAGMFSTGAQAAPGGCEVGQSVQAGALGFVALHNCRYTASGPGAYTAVAVSNWKISISRDGGASFKTILAGGDRVVQITPATMGGASVYAPNTGTIPTLAGDIVDVSIYPEPLKPVPGPGTPTVSLPYAGFAEAHDA
jgi:hypothetical protein